MLRRSPNRSSRRASILLTVLIVVVLMTLVGVKFFEWSFAEYRATASSIRQSQTRLNAESGIEFMKYVLMEDSSSSSSQGGLADNPNRFRGVLMQDSELAALRSRFSIIAPGIDNGEYEGIRFGLEDASCRMNLNSLLIADAREPDAGVGRQMLMGLPGMTESIADAILDWIDADDEARELGAEISYYTSLATPYTPQNGPLESLDQLLMVRDVTPELLYGYDRNRNGVIDAGEGADVLAGGDGVDGRMSRGWSAYLTLYSAERNYRADGRPKIDVNQEDLQQLESELSEIFSVEQTNFILAYRQGGAYDEEAEGDPFANEAAGDSSGEETATADQIDFDFDAGGSVPIENVLDLVGTRTRVVQKGDTDRTIVETPFPDEPGELAIFLPLLMDNLTATGEEVVPGRLNVNQAPRVLLEGIPAMPPLIVEQIISMRDFEPAAEQPNRQYETWLLVEGLVTLDQMKDLMPVLNAGGDVYQAQVVGYYEKDGPATRLEVLVDATGPLPEVRWVTDLSPLGAGYSEEILGAEVVETPEN